MNIPPEYAALAAGAMALTEFLSWWTRVRANSLSQLIVQGLIAALRSQLLPLTQPIPEKPIVKTKE